MLNSGNVNKNFPYPVLGNINDFDGDNLFALTIRYGAQGNQYEFSCNLRYNAYRDDYENFMTLSTSFHRDNENINNNDGNLEYIKADL